MNNSQEIGNSQCGCFSCDHSVLLWDAQDNIRGCYCSKSQFLVENRDTCELLSTNCMEPSENCKHLHPQPERLAKAKYVSRGEDGKLVESGQCGWSACNYQLLLRDKQDQIHIRYCSKLHISVEDYDSCDYHNSAYQDSLLAKLAITIVSASYNQAEMERINQECETQKNIYETIQSRARQELHSFAYAAQYRPQPQSKPPHKNVNLFIVLGIFLLSCVFLFKFI